MDRFPRVLMCLVVLESTISRLLETIISFKALVWIKDIRLLVLGFVKRLCFVPLSSL